MNYTSTVQMFNVQKHVLSDGVGPQASAVTAVFSPLEVGQCSVMTPHNTRAVQWHAVYQPLLTSEEFRSYISGDP
jgi:hypothetical protein